MRCEDYGKFLGKLGRQKGFFLKKWLYFCIVKKGGARPQQGFSPPNR